MTPDVTVARASTQRACHRGLRVGHTALREVRPRERSVREDVVPNRRGLQTASSGRSRCGSRRPQAGTQLALTAGMTNPKAEELKARTKRFALAALSFKRTLPCTDEATDIGRQLSRAATGVAANYRAACRSRSDAEFAARIGVVREEADESAFWLEILDGGWHFKMPTGVSSS